MYITQYCNPSTCSPALLVRVGEPLLDVNRGLVVLEDAGSGVAAHEEVGEAVALVCLHLGKVQLELVRVRAVVEFLEDLLDDLFWWIGGGRGGECE